MEEKYEKLLCFGKEEIGKHFFLSEDDKKAFEICFEVFEKIRNHQVSKGVILSGSYGLGKTTLVKLLNKKYNFPFAYFTARDVFNDTKLNGLERVLYYSKGYWSSNSSRFQKIKGNNIFFDDLGQESAILNDYGNKVVVMREIILELYELYIQRKTQLNSPTLIFTTNMNVSELADRYGGDVSSRLMEMCNYFEYSKSNIDKRQLESL